MAFVRGIHRWPVNSPHKGPVTQKMSPFDDVIMSSDMERVPMSWPHYAMNWVHGTSITQAIWLGVQPYNKPRCPETAGSHTVIYWSWCHCSRVGIVWYLLAYILHIFWISYPATTETLWDNSWLTAAYFVILTVSSAVSDQMLSTWYCRYSKAVPWQLDVML